MGSSPRDGSTASGWDTGSVTAAPTDARSAVVRQGLSVAVATGLYGVSFGALSVTSGLSVWQTCVLSLLLFSGGSQFALIGVLGGAGRRGPPVAASSLLACGTRSTGCNSSRSCGRGAGAGPPSRS